MRFSSSSRRLRIEQLENRRLLACVPIGDTQIECVASEGAGTPENVWFRDQATPHVIEGYTSQTSFSPGDTLELKVSSNSAVDYRIEVFRLGWYEGNGARQVACLPNCTGGTLVATDQGVPAPDPVTLMVDANWSTTDAFVVPNDWESGYYLASLVVESGPSTGDAHFIPFIVTANSSRNADILVEVPTNTWQAYNSWGGHSLYDPQAADKVSFDRPYNNLDDILRYEYQLVRFLEREGYDVEYATNTDVHRDPSLLLDHSLVISTGHDEYWTSEMRSGFESARDAGVDLGFFTSNAAYWQVRYEDAERTMVGYKVKPPNAGDDPEPDPSKKSMRFRELTPARPECSLIGVQYMSTATPGFTSDQAFYEDYTVNDALLTDSWFAGTGIQPGATFPKVVGYEWDQIVTGCTSAQVETLFSYESGTTKDAHSTRYTAPSGARVFSTGSMGFSYALDDWRFSGTAVEPASPELQAFTRNVLDDLSARPHYEQSPAGDGLVVIEAENSSRRIDSPNHAWSTVSEAAASGGAAVVAGPDIGGGFSTPNGSPQIDYDINFVETGTHYVWILGRAGGSSTGTSDSVHAGLDSVGPTTARRIQNFTDAFGWSTQISGGARATINVASTGQHTFNLWMREDGFVADRIVLTTNPTLDIESLLGTSTYQQSDAGDGLVVIEAEQFDASTPGPNHAWTPISDVDASEGQALLAGPDIGQAYLTTAGSPRVDYTIDFVETGTHYLWVLGKAAGVTAGTSDSLHAGLDGISPPSATRIQGFTDAFGWSTKISGGSRTTIDVPFAGAHTLNLWMREDGFVADKLVLTTNPTLDIESLLGTSTYQQSDAGEGLVVIEAEQFDASTSGPNHAWTPISDVDASEGQALLAGPDIGQAYLTTAGSPRVDYTIDFVETGTHYLWVLGKAAGVTAGTSDSLHAGLDGISPPSATRIQGFTDAFGWSTKISGGSRTTIDVPFAGAHTLNLWMREDGFVADKLVLTTNPTLDIDSLLEPPILEPSFFQPNDADGVVLIESEQFDASREASGHAWQITSDATAQNSSSVFAGPDTGANISSNYADNSPRLDYYIDFTKTGTHYLWVLGKAAGSSRGTSDSIHAGLDNAEIPALKRIQGFATGYSWSSSNSTNSRASFEVDSAGVHALNLWMREDGMQVDQILVTTNPTTDIQLLLLASVSQPAGIAGEFAATRPLALDTNRDGYVAPSDVLLIVNHLNSNKLTTAMQDRYDTNGDGHVSPIDALLVINAVNHQVDGSQDAEGESAGGLADLAILSLEEELKRRREQDWL